MLKKWQIYIDLGLGVASLLTVVVGALFLWMRPAHIPVSNKPPPKSILPKGAFKLPQENYDAIGMPFLSLQFAPMSMQLPDLKKYLVYYGKNGRPDAVEENTLLHFSFTGNKAISSVMPGEKLYILYDRRLHPPQYVFSPGNAETSLWMEATVKGNAQGNEAQVKVTRKSESDGLQDGLLRQPEASASFAIPEKEYIRMGNTGWELGKNKVDATILARQKARWYGQDAFLARHGGKEYAFAMGKQRLDFGEGDDVYSVFVTAQDSLVWEHNGWKVVKPGADSLGKPMLVVKKIEDRLMSLELWDPEGKGKVVLNLLRSSEPMQQAGTLQGFKFVGARTRTQFVFEIDKKRMLLSPKDWLLKTQKGWVKLISPKEIDDYVDRKTVGPLFVFDAVERREDRSFLKGSLFNSSRTDVQSIEIPLQQPGATPKRVKPAPAAADEDDEEAYDDDEDDLDFLADDDDLDYDMDDDDD